MCSWDPYLWKPVALLELGNGEGPHVVAHLLSGLDGSLYQPLSGPQTRSEQAPPGDHVGGPTFTWITGKMWMKSRPWI